MRKFLLLAVSASLLAGCGEEGKMEKAINTYLSKNEICYSFNSKEANADAFSSFNNGNPVKVSVGFFSNPQNEAILNGLQNSGLLEIHKEQSGFTTTQVLTATEAGQKAKFWDPDKGACIGHPVVTEISDWTEPAGSAEVKGAMVAYKWKLADVPVWVDKKVFTEITGLSQPVEDKIFLLKTKKGWTTK